MSLGARGIIECREEAFIEGKWLLCRPSNAKYMTVFERVKDAWLVLIGKADAVVLEYEK